MAGTTVRVNGPMPGRATLTVHLVPTLRWRIRARIALLLIGMAARVLRCGLRIADDEGEV